ncbi:MAG: acyl-CoA/acyl-ACP dehydrogenase [Chloroflexi bacterium]|nr:acyl-CoA/acyl-ACP dehydrogenase [Chloroflexota bacterium]
MAVLLEPATSSLLDRVREAAPAQVGAHAAAVDREARFPAEALAWLRSERLLGANVPAELGGLALSVHEIVELVQVLAAQCSTTAMVLAMHCIQVAAIAEHTTGGYLVDYLREVARDQLLIASVTSEVGVGGDLRRSKAPVETRGDRLFVSKQASTISYGRFADSYLLTARRAPDAEEPDQVLVLLRGDEVRLERTGEWDSLGMRGTCSEAFRIEATFASTAIVEEPFALIAERTMVPISHILWAGCWLGIAFEAFRRARQYCREQTTRGGGAPDSSLARLSDMSAKLEAASALLSQAVDSYESGRYGQPTIADGVRVNSLKLIVSETAQQVVLDALAITGMAGYSERSPFSVARLLRDVLSSSLMIGNDRIKRSTGVSLLTVRNLF